MAAPTSYTETTFKTYLDALIGAVADALGWSVLGGQYNEALNEALLAYGADDIATITGTENIRKLRTLGRAEVWRAVLAEVAADYDFEADGGSYKRSQVYEHARRMFEAAVTEALVYDSNYAVEVGAFTDYDPYERLTVEEYEALVEAE